MELGKHSDPSALMTDVAIAQSPFFRLPRELRDTIYDFVALNANSLYYEFLLKSGEPVRKAAYVTSDVSSGGPPLAGQHAYVPTMWQTTPEDTDYENGLDRVCKQFTVEYLTAVERHIERLLSFGRDEPRLANCFWEGHKWVRLEFTRTDSAVAQSFHALTIPVPIVSRLPNLFKLHAVAYFTFRFHDSEDLGPREHQFISLEDVDGSGRCRFRFPEHMLQKLDDLINGADWSSSKNRLKERILWIQYFKREAVKK